MKTRKKCNPFNCLEHPHKVEFGKAPCLCGSYDHKDGSCLDKPTHTPGPWTADKNGDVIARYQGTIATDKWIASCGTPAEGFDCEANARLIAAAPELLEALQEIQAIAETAAKTDLIINRLALLAIVSKAIAKAEVK